MSSSPTAATSTTASSTNSASDRPGASNAGEDRPTHSVSARRSASSACEPRDHLSLIACGALAQPAAEIADRRGWRIDVHPLPPLLHNQPQLIAREVRALAVPLLASGCRVAIGYADCGTYGALDELCGELGIERLPGLHCYDVYAGPERLAAFFEAQPGTYVLTDFLVRSFARTVVRELGLDRYPELRADYFGSYTRAVWLAQRPDDELRGFAREAADTLGLPLTVVDTGHAGLEAALESLVSS